MCKHFSVARTTFLRGRDNISQCKEITFLDGPRLMTDHLKAPTHLVSPQVLAPHVCITCITVCALDEFYIFSQTGIGHGCSHCQTEWVVWLDLCEFIGSRSQNDSRPDNCVFCRRCWSLAAKDAMRATSKGPGDTCFCPRVSAPLVVHLGLAGPHLALSVAPGRQS